MQQIWRFWHFTLNFKKNWQYTPVCKLQRHALVSILDYPKMELCPIKLKKKLKIKKKNCMELEFPEIEFHAKKNL